VEVKAVRPGRNSVSVSSLEQLDGGSSPLTLVLVTLSSGREDDIDSFEVRGLIGSIRSCLEAEPAALSEFESRLAAAGYLDEADYATTWFSFQGFRFFDVQGAFPRLVPTSVPVGVLSARYEIDIRAMGATEITSVLVEESDGRP
jgi:hypothetical protein